MNAKVVASARIWALALASVLAAGACVVVANPEPSNTPAGHHGTREPGNTPQGAAPGTQTATPGEQDTAPGLTARTPAQPRPGLHDSGGGTTDPDTSKKPGTEGPETSMPGPVPPPARTPAKPGQEGLQPPAPGGSGGSPLPPTGRTAGSPCSQRSHCASGICEGLGCGVDEGRCAPEHRMCTRDLRQYCGCDGKTFSASGSCPMNTFRHTGPCREGR